LTVSGHVDITHSVRIKCAHKECDEIDLCVPCFMEGKELQKHEAWHAYKVVVCVLYNGTPDDTDG
jgi:transcriptional adapter 2-alpha